MDNLTRNFSKHEFACRCKCGFDDVSLDLVARLQVARDLYGQAISISSGCRCRERNDLEGGSVNSSHLSGLAVDIRCDNSRDRKLLIDCLIQAGFSRIGVYKDQPCIHIDVDKGKTQDVLWVK